MYGQVGINTTNPQGIFHIDGGKDNPPTGVPDISQQSNDVVVTSSGQLGVGTTTPTAKLELNSGVSDFSGLKFTQLTSSTPVSGGATLGVDSSGNIVTVLGSSFLPDTGRAVLKTSPGTEFVQIPANTANYDLVHFTLQEPGTYLVTYSVRAEIQVAGGGGWLTSFLSTAPSAGNLVPNTEVLIITSKDASREIIGSTSAGTYIVTNSVPTDYYVGVKAVSLDGIIYDNEDGRTAVSYVKVTP